MFHRERTQPENPAFKYSNGIVLPTAHTEFAPKLNRKDRRALKSKRSLTDLNERNLAMIARDAIRRERGHKTYPELEYSVDPKSGVVNLENTVNIVRNQGSTRIHDSGFSIGTISESGTWPEQRGLLTNGGGFEEHIAKHIVPELSQESRDAFVDYLDKGGRIVYAFDLKPSKHFLNLFERYRTEQYGGADIMAQVMALSESGVLRRELKQNGDNGNGNDKKEDKNNAVTLERLLNEESVRSAIHFTAISADEKGDIPVDVKKALAELNDHILPYGFNYLIKMVEKKKSTKDFLWALGFSAFGMAFGTGLFVANQMGAEKAYGQLHSDIFKTSIDRGEDMYKGFEQASSSLVGETVALEVNMAGSSDGPEGDKGKKPKKELAETIADRVKGKNNSTEEKKIKTIDKILNKLPSWIAKRAPRYSAMIPGLGVVILGTVGSAVIASTPLSLLAFLAIAPINRFMYTAWEIKQRADHLKKQGIREDKDKKDTAVRYLRAQDGKFTNKRLAKLAETHPDWALAIREFTKNRVGTGALFGTFASVPVLLPLALAFPAIPRQIIYAFSGIVFENLTGAIVGAKSAVRKAWRSFEDTLPANIKLEKESEKLYNEKHNGDNGNGNGVLPVPAIRRNIEEPRETRQEIVVQ